MPCFAKARWFGLAALAVSLVLTAASPAKAQKAEALGSLGFGLSLRSGGAALAARETLSASYWATPSVGAGIEGGGFANFTWGSSNVSCPAEPCTASDAEDRSGWFLVPRVFTGAQFSILHWFAAFGLGYAHVEFEFERPAPYESWMVSLEGGVSVDLGPLSIVPSVCFDAIDGGAAFYPKLGLGLDL